MRMYVHTVDARRHVEVAVGRFLTQPCHLHFLPTPLQSFLYGERVEHVTFNEFVNKELILFSNADNERSIPSLVDGESYAAHIAALVM